jgi:phage-related protein
MAEFTWTPSRGFTLDTTPKVNVAKFGDGYAQRTPSGINNIEQVWQLSFQNQVIATANAIISFLASKQGSTPFTWLPPGEITEVLVVCTKWSRTYDSHLTASITATFERVYG